MPLEDFSWMLSEVRRKLFYIVAIFGAGALLSFPFMGSLIKKIEYDMFYRLNLPGNIDVSRQLADISGNLSLISNELAANNSIIAQNLTKISGDILNISQNVNFHQPAIIYLTPLEVLMLEFKMSLIFGTVLVSPFILYYAYRGVKGRLTNMIPFKKSMVLSATLAAIVLFLLGVGYSYLFMLPFFLNYIYQDAMSLGISATFSVSEFINFVVMVTVIMGFAFELPLIMTALVRLGITSRQTLAHYRKHAYVILLILAAWVTPDPTMFSQVMVMLPFVVLYEVSLMLLRLTGRGS